jgi:hypothetical protein
MAFCGERPLPGVIGEFHEEDHSDQDQRGNETRGRSTPAPPVEADLVLFPIPDHLSTLNALTFSGNAQQNLLQNVLREWAGTDPQAASAWAASFPQGEMRDQLFANLMNRWAKTDPSSAATWLDSLGADESRDAAVGALIGRIASADPEAAVQWAASINDAAMREAETQEAVQTWFEVDPARARAWLANSNLDNEIKRRFLAPQG